MLGEFEKQINKKFPKYEYGRNLDPDADWVIEEIFKILEEAKKEFPKYPNKIEPYGAFDPIIEFANKTHKWFKKWFGDE